MKKIGLASIFLMLVILLGTGCKPVESSPSNPFVGRWGATYFISVMVLDVKEDYTFTLTGMSVLSGGDLTGTYTFSGNKATFDDGEQKYDVELVNNTITFYAETLGPVTFTKMQ